MRIAVIGISIIILAVVLYSIFGKTTTTSQTGGGGSTDTHGSAFGWLSGILNGLHLSVA